MKPVTDEQGDAILEQESGQQVALTDGVRSAPARQRHISARAALITPMISSPNRNPPAPVVKAVPVLDPSQQFALSEGRLSSRQKVIDNLPGTREFCPLVHRTPVLESYVRMELDERAREVLGRTHPDVVTRAAAFLLLQDSRSSFQIEREQPSPAHGQVGTRYRAGWRHAAERRGAGAAAG